MAQRAAAIKARTPRAKSATWVKLEVIAHCQPGAILTYEDIEQMTDVPMTEPHKAMLRRVLKSYGIEYLCVPGKSIELASPHTCLQVVEHKVYRSENALHRTVTAHKNVERFYPGLSKDERDQAVFIGTALGTMLAVAQQLHEKSVERSHTEYFRRQMRQNLLGTDTAAETKT